MLLVYVTVCTGYKLVLQFSLPAETVRHICLPLTLSAISCLLPRLPETRYDGKSRNEPTICGLAYTLWSLLSVYVSGEDNLILVLLVPDLIVWNAIKYSRLSLSRLRLSRITAYLEEKI